MVKALPIVLLAGCIVWKCIDLVGRLYLKLQPQQTKKQLRKLAVSAVVFFAALLVAGEAIQAVQVVSYVDYTSQERFEENIENYLLVYNSYRESGKHNGPVLEEGVERIDNTYMDHALLGNDRYDRHKGLFAIDYDGWRTYHVDSWSERLAAKDVSLMISAVICAAGLVVFWAKDKKKNVT